MKKIFGLILIIIFFISACTTVPKDTSLLLNDSISNESDQTVQPWEDGLRTDPDGNSFEWWYFDASFTDGSTAVIFFSTKSFLNPRGEADPGVTIVITDPMGNKIEATDKPGKESFYAGSQNLDVIIGDSYFKGDLDSCKLFFSKDDIQAELQLVSQAPSWRPGTGISYYGSKKKNYFAWLPAIPYGSVTGTLSYNGETVSVQGTGYHDHNWGNIRLDKVKTQWYWGRARIDDYTLIFSEMLTSPQYGGKLIPVFYLAKGDKIISNLQFDYEFEADGWKRHSGGRDYPTKIRIVFTQDNLETTVTISNPEFIEEKYLMDEASWLIKVFSRPFVNPYYFRFNADFSLSIKEDEKVIYNTGKGIFEMMLLRGVQTVR